MLNRDDVRMAFGVGAIVVTLGVGTCSMNSRIDDTHRRIDDTSRRMDEGFANIYRRLDDMQTDIREIRTLLFETIKNNPPAD